MRRREVRGRQPSCTIGPISSPRYCQIIGMSISMSSANSSVSCSLSNNKHQQHQTPASPAVCQTTTTTNIKLQRFLQSVKLKPSTTSNPSISCSLSNNNINNIKLQHLLQSVKQQPPTTSNSSVSCNLSNNDHQQHQTPVSPAVCQTTIPPVCQSITYIYMNNNKLLCLSNSNKQQCS